MRLPVSDMRGKYRPKFWINTRPRIETPDQTRQHGLIEPCTLAQFASECGALVVHIRTGNDFLMNFVARTGPIYWHMTAHRVSISHGIPEVVYLLPL